ncbi:MAG: HEAT repeat domain-containing protein [Desulfomonile tiedjei]|nr:HEAT repeat domain-containing protein [Desulfomonile tiedjei]
MLSNAELEQIQAAAKKMSRPVYLQLNSGGTEDRFQANLLNTARQISGVSMNRIELADDLRPVFPEKPSITVASEGVGNIHYLAVPEGPEFGPFLDALMWVGGAKAPPIDPALPPLDELKVSTDALVLIAPVCPHCPRVVRQVLSLAVCQPLISAVVVDAVQFQDMADRFKVKATPTTIINEAFTLVGSIELPQLVGSVLESGATDSFTSILNSMIQSGRAEDAGVLLCKEDQPEAILPLYTSHEFSSRMGALVAMEEALAESPHSLDPIVPDLITLLTHEDIGLRGDTAELLGKIGNPVAIPALQNSLNDPDPDVREAVEEALGILSALRE